MKEFGVLGFSCRYMVFCFMDGNPMYRFTNRLGLLKPKLKSLHHQHVSYITSHVIEANTR